MRRFLTFLPGLLLVLAPGVALAGPVELGVAGFGASTVPLLQDVSSSDDLFGEPGTGFGFRVPVKVIPVVTLEPYYSHSSYGERTEELPEGSGIEYTREGFDANAFGINALLGNTLSRGFKIFPYAGIGKTKLERTGQDIDELTWNFGLGLGFSATERFAIQLRSEFDMVVTDDTSRKFASVGLALQYKILPMGVTP